MCHLPWAHRCITYFRKLKYLIYLYIEVCLKYFFNFCEKHFVCLFASNYRNFNSSKSLIISKFNV